VCVDSLVVVLAADVRSQADALKDKRRERIGERTQFEQLYADFEASAEEAAHCEELANDLIFAEGRGCPSASG
jgi:hypothetical protein